MSADKPGKHDEHKNVRGQWGGRDQWVCPHCPYDSLDVVEFGRHVEAHAPAVKTEPTGLVTAAGEPIERAVLDLEARETRTREG